MPSYELKPLRRFEFAQDVSFIRADLHRHVLLMNDGVDKLRVLDIDDMSDRIVDLTPFASEFLIHSWTLDQDGECSLLGSSDPLPFAIGLNHRTWQAVRIDLPTTTTMLSPVLWTTPRFAVMDFSGTVWNASRSGLVSAPQDTAEQQRNDIYSALVARFSIFSFDWQTRDACVVGGGISELGMASAPDWVVRPAHPWTGSEIAAAHHRGHIFVCHRDRIDVATADGSEQVFSAPTGFDFYGIAIGPSKLGSFLAVLSGANGGSRLPCRVEIYDLVIR